MLYKGEWNREEVDYQALVNQWHVVALSEDLDASKPKAVRLLGEDLVLWRDESGGVHAWKDYCGHRGAKLSLGCVKQGQIECPYHGWRYDRHGNCKLVPAHPDRAGPSSERLIFRHFAQEQFGFIWASLEQPDRRECQIFCVRAGNGLPSDRPSFHQVGLMNRSPYKTAN